MSTELGEVVFEAVQTELARAMTLPDGSPLDGITIRHGGEMVPILDPLTRSIAERITAAIRAKSDLGLMPEPAKGREGVRTREILDDSERIA